MAKRTRHAETDCDFDIEFEGLSEAPRARRRRLKRRLAERKAHEVHRSTSLASLERAAKRLKSSRAAERVLVVPQWNMDIAVDAMRRAGVSGVVTNLCGTRRQRVEVGEKRRAAVERAREDSALGAALLESAAIVQGVLDEAGTPARADDDSGADAGPMLCVVGEASASVPELATAPEAVVAPVVEVDPTPEPALVPTLTAVPTPEAPPVEPVVKQGGASLAGRFMRAMGMGNDTARFKRTRPDAAAPARRRG